MPALGACSPVRVAFVDSERILKESVRALSYQQQLGEREKAMALDLQWLARATRAFEKQLEIETTAQAGAQGDGAGKLALARAIAGQAQGGDDTMLRIVSDRSLRRYSQGHVDARVQQVAELQQRAGAAVQMARDAAQSALAGARGHLWLPPSTLAQITAVHDANLAAAMDLRAQTDLLARGFADLPVDAALHDTVPEPVEIAP